jgi:hypothetical protein
LLFTGSWSLRGGVAARPDTSRFLAYASWKGDSLLFVPYESWKVTRGLIRADLLSRQNAVLHQRELFQRIARIWAAALPNNPATKEAVAISLEMLGDPSALDTLLLARRLATDDLHRVRLGAEEVMMRAGFGRSDERHLRVAASLADSLLSTSDTTNREMMAALRTVAVIRRRCRLAGHFSARSADPRNSSRLGVPHFAYAAAESLTVASALGCGTSADTLAYAYVESAIADMDRNNARANVDRLAYALLGRAMRLSNYVDTARLGRLAGVSGDQMLSARLSSRVRNDSAVRTFLERRRALASSGAADRTPDAAYGEAVLWLSVGDSASARAWLDALLARPSWIELMLDRPVDGAAVMSAIRLRADLASAAGDSAMARKWSLFLGSLWTQADAELPLRQ